MSRHLRALAHSKQKWCLDDDNGYYDIRWEQRKKTRKNRREFDRLEALVQLAERPGRFPTFEEAELWDWLDCTCETCGGMSEAQREWLADHRVHMPRWGEEQNRRWGLPLCSSRRQVDARGHAVGVAEFAVPADKVRLATADALLLPEQWSTSNHCAHPNFDEWPR